jgi:hypothetical protein
MYNGIDIERVKQNLKSTKQSMTGKGKVTEKNSKETDQLLCKCLKGA